MHWACITFQAGYHTIYKSIPFTISLSWEAKSSMPPYIYKAELVHNLCKLSPHIIFSITLLYRGMFHGLEIEKLRFKGFD